MGMFVNEGCEKDPVMTEEHQDSKDAFFGVSCVCAFGEYEGGDLICWELEAVVELKPGDLFFFPAHLVTHSNTKVKGERHSLVAFIQQSIIDWYEKRIIAWMIAKEGWKRRQKREKKCKKKEKKKNIA